MALAGVVLLGMALSTAFIRRLPISTTGIYLGLGLLLGPLGFGVLRLDAIAAAEWLERAAEVAVIVALFVGGLRLRLPVTDPAWRAAFRLAGPVMLVCILGVAAMLHLALGLDAGLALLIGAILAPTDPVLAGAVSVNDAADHDRMRYGLSGEAGLNDGMAFPFVVFALMWIDAGPGAWIGGWALHRLVWAVPAGLVIGYLMGRGVGRMAIALRVRDRGAAMSSDFLALALIALSYVLAESVGAWGFLAVFSAGLGLRREEIAVVEESPAPMRAVPPDRDEAAAHQPAEHLVGPPVLEHELESPVIAAGVLVAETLSFGDTAGRLLEVILVVTIGVLLRPP
jgi:NhaP-type Na+/H+ or K+/H+ antiporter